MGDMGNTEHDGTDGEEALDRLEATVDRFASRREAELVASWDSRFEKLLDWARKVSEKTGIPLENL